jgi:hypothetical protein
MSYSGNENEELLQLLRIEAAARIYLEIDSGRVKFPSNVDLLYAANIAFIALEQLIFKLDAIRDSKFDIVAATNEFLKQNDISTTLED